MTDLVKRARNALWAVLENQAVDTGLLDELADEIERLQGELIVSQVKTTASINRSIVGAWRKAVIEDMREWYDLHGLAGKPSIDAYAKDRGIE